MEKYVPSNSIEIQKYDLVIVGGGPSTLAFICYLFQNNYHEKVFNSMNILIVEKEEHFGSGCLGKYGINTNTSSEGFVRLIMHKEDSKIGKLALSPERNPMKISKNYSVKENLNKFNLKPVKNKPNKKPINLFNEFFMSSAVESLLKIGNRPAPLTLVGYFLDCLGNFLVDYIKKNFNKNILMKRSEVINIKVYKNEEFGIYINNQNNKNILVKTKCLILATGGKQNIENLFYKQIIQIKGIDNVYISDNILQEAGFKSLIENLKKKEKAKKKIVIIGGSHSGFSCAWILLNSPSTYKNILVGKDYIPKHDNNCRENEYCNCNGKVTDKNWDNNIDYKIDDIEINIIYRDHIKVYYPSEEDAINDNYTFYNPKEALNKQGKVYPFIGIRGDAKELYRRIIRGEENRIKLIKSNQDEDQINYIKNADVVIWACGYVTNHIKMYDYKNVLVEFLTDDTGTIEVDKTLRIVKKNKTPINNLFGIGQGYSTKTPEIINGKKARADSIHLYNTHISRKLYKSLELYINRLSIVKPHIGEVQAIKRKSLVSLNNKDNKQKENIVRPSLLNKKKNFAINDDKKLKYSLKERKDYDNLIRNNIFKK